MKRFEKYALAALSLSMAFGASASALIINFDPPPTGDLPATLTAMGNSPGSAVPTSAQLSNQYESDGVLFSSSSPFVAVVSGAGVASPNAIGGVTSSGLLSYADPVTFTFVEPGTTTPGVTSNVSIQADPDGIPGQFATFTAFDIHGNLLKSVTVNDTGSEIFSLSVAGIHSAKFVFPTTSAGVPTTGSAFGEGTGIALDNLTFGTVTTGVNSTGVPLPPMVWDSLAILGSLIGVQAIRGRRQTFRI